MSFPSVRDIKRAQKESLLNRHITQWMREASLDDPKLNDYIVNRVKLSPDKGTCVVYFFSMKGKEHFEKHFNYLNDYKSALRKALSEAIASRYVVNLIFKYDDAFEKQQKIENLIDSLKKEDKL